MVESGYDTLPRWLTYDQQSHALQGVPSKQDIGTFILSANDDLFAVTVRSLSQEVVAPSANPTSKPTGCGPHDSTTRAKVVLNSNFSALSSQSKAILIQHLSKHLNLNRDYVSIRAQTSEDLLMKALVSGLGDYKKNTTTLGSVVYWTVGCGPVKAYQMEILEALQSSAKDGSLSRALDSGVRGWHVDISKPKHPSGKRRLKRAMVTATPSPSSSVGE